MFHLEGGPGLAATAVAGFYLGPGAPYAATRDVVLIDQRGTGGSFALRCPVLEDRPWWQDKYTREDTTACRRTLSERADLTQYSTERAAEDLDDVRRALSAPRIDLWALSYGTRLAQVYEKRYPTHVRSAVLVGFAPLDYRTPLFHAATAQRVLDRIFDECRQDATCGKKYSHLREEWSAVLRLFDRGPVAVPVKSATVPLRRGRFAELLRNTLTTAAGQRMLPAIVHAAAAGDLGPFVAAVSGPAPPFAEGEYLSVVCAEAVDRIPADASSATAGTFLGDYRVAQERAACAGWPRAAIPSDFFEPLRRSIPTLVVSGSMDYVTSPEWAREFCATTAGCKLIEIPDLGHAPFDLDAWVEGDCFDRVVQSFFTDPARVDGSCVPKMKPPPFK
jgi:pimeloyl-ACP methyl ester carboxylesterase